MTILNSNREDAGPGSPQVLLRTVQPLVIEVDEGRFVISSPLVARRLKVESHIVDLLIGARDGLGAELATGPQGGAVKRLAEFGFLVPQTARPPAPWDSWGTTAWSFHSRCRDTPFIDSGSADAADRYDRYREMVSARPRPSNVRTAPSNEILLLPRVRGRYDVSYIDVLQARRTHRHFEAAGVALDPFSDMLHYTFAPLRFADAGAMGVLQLRAAASGGARHETEAFVFVFDVEDVRPGLYWYDGIRHGLVLVKSEISRDLVEDLTYNQGFFRAAAFGVFTAAVSPRMSWKYPYPRAYKLLLQNVGHVAQVFSMNAVALGLGASMTGAIRDSQADQLLGLDVPTEFTTFAMACGIPKTHENGLPLSIRTPNAADGHS